MQWQNRSTQRQTEKWKTEIEEVEGRSKDNVGKEQSEEDIEEVDKRRREMDGKKQWVGRWLSPWLPPTLSTSLDLFPDNQLHKTWYSSTHHSSLCVIHHWKYLIGGSILFFCYIPQSWQGMACTLTLPCLDTDEYFSSPHWYFRRVHIWVGVLISGWMALIAELCLNGGNLRTKAEVGPHNQQSHMQQKSNKNTNRKQYFIINTNIKTCDKYKRQIPRPRACGTISNLNVAARICQLIWQLLFKQPTWSLFKAIWWSKSAFPSKLELHLAWDKQQLELATCSLLLSWGICYSYCESKFGRDSAALKLIE